MLAHRRYRFGDFTLDLRRGALFRGAAEVKLRPKSFAVLQALVERPGELVSKDELLERVWGRSVVTDGVITQCLIDIRRALGDDAQQIVRTVPRRGYIFTSPVTTAADEPSIADPTPDAGPPVPESPLEAAPETQATSELAAALSPEPAPASTIAPVTSSRSVRSNPAFLGVLMLAVLGALAWWWTGRSSFEASPPAARTADQAGESRKSIAVLPFVNLTGEPDGEYVSDGVAEEILHLLTQSRDLRVIARSSSFAFKGQPTSIQDIAAKLRVKYVVEGSVRRAGDSLRVNVQLVDASNSSQVWSKAYDRDVRDLLAVQEDIAQHIATELQSSLGSAAGAAGHTPDPAAYDAYLRARFFFQRRIAGDLDRAELAYREAIRLDPQLARAWAGLAGVYRVLIGEPGADVDSLLQKQKAAVDAALAIDPRLAEARIRAASYYAQVGDLARADKEAKLARELAPDEPLVLWWQATVLTFDGRLDEALEIQRHILGLDPTSRVTRVNLASTLLAAGRFDEARAEFLHFQELGDRPDPDVNVDLARIDVLQGRYPQALAAAERWADSPDRDFVRAVAAFALKQDEVARAAEARLRAGTTAAHAVRLAELFAHRARPDDAFHWMDVAYERLGSSPFLSEEDQWLYQLKLSPFFRSLHADARWAEWRERGFTSANAGKQPSQEPGK